jgi:hypothetical protein
MRGIVTSAKVGFYVIAVAATRGIECGCWPRRRRLNGLLDVGQAEHGRAKGLPMRALRSIPWVRKIREM